MGRQARVVFPRMPHHVTPRDNYGQDVFFAAGDRVQYLAWLTVVVISRDVVILGGIIALKLFEVDFRIEPTRISKWATASQLLTVFLAILRELSPLPYWVLMASCWLTTYFTVASGLVYMIRGMRLLNGTPK